ncbi:uncharacterized protein KD926_004523 [Aspergillus affinis]|uniref:uncharacterized protein n=1 Tax=Aspergillus affinis TaxID=1070780 RepID=UPI0022FE7F3A|nr:uncharacterized protein KD926_004523 [Aspergillus affinis]KAI9043020.1 hypothetical protein KD926_004523 [Aspergillus affinis]
MTTMSSQFNPQTPSYTPPMPSQYTSRIPIYQAPTYPDGTPRCRCPGYHILDECPLSRPAGIALNSGLRWRAPHTTGNQNESSLVEHEEYKDRLNRLMETPVPAIAKFDTSHLRRTHEILMAMAESTHQLAATASKGNEMGKLSWRDKRPGNQTDGVGASADVSEKPESSAQNAGGQTEESNDPKLEERFLAKQVDMMQAVLNCCDLLLEAAGGAAAKGDKPEPFNTTSGPSDPSTRDNIRREWLQVLIRIVVFNPKYRKSVKELGKAQRDMSQELRKLQAKLPSIPDSQDVEDSALDHEWSWVDVEEVFVDHEEP